MSIKNESAQKVLRYILTSGGFRDYGSGAESSVGLFFKYILIAKTILQIQF